MSEHAEAHRRLADVVDALEEMGASVGEANVNRARDGDVYVDLTADLSDGVDVPIVEEIDAGEELAELRQERDRLQDRLDELDGRFDEDDWEAMREDLRAARRERDRLQERTGQLTETINRQAEEISELRGTRDHDVDDRAATVRVTVDGEEHTDVIRECEQSRGLPDGVSVYLERVEAHDADDDLRGTLDERNEQLDEARRRAQEAEQRVEALEDGEDSDETADGEVDLQERYPDVPKYVLKAMASRAEIGEPPQELRMAYEERYLDVEFADRRCTECGEVCQHQIETDSYRVRRSTECSECHTTDAAEPVPEESDQEGADGDPDDDPDDSAPDLPADLDDPPRALAEAMAELGESRVDGLADHLDVSGGTVHGRLSALRDHDLVDARPAPDSGRAKLYSLATGDGEDEEPLQFGNPQDAVLAVLEEQGPLQAGELREAAAERCGLKASSLKDVYEEMAREGDLARWADAENGSYTHYGLPEQEPEDVDVEHEYAWPRDCGECGATLASTLEGAVHRTEEHGATQSRLNCLEPGEFADRVEAAGSVGDLVESFDWGAPKTLRLLGIYGLEDAVGGDVELSDVTDVEFEGVDSESDGAATPEDTKQVVQEEPDHVAARICAENDLTREEVVDAIADAQAVYHVKRELHLREADVEALLQSLGLFADLDRGGSVGRDRVEAVVHEQVPPPAAADGGDGS